MKLFKWSLDEDARFWFKTIPRGSISSLKCFHIAFYQHFKRVYPPNALLEDCCANFNDEDIQEVNDLVKDVCETPFQEHIYPHQEALPNEQERE